MERIPFNILLATVSSCLVVVACGHLNRHPRSGYYDEGLASGPRVADYYDERATYQKELAREELGLVGEGELSEQESQRVMDRARLRQLEKRIETHRERSQYYAIKGYLASDKERIAFLKIPSFETRARWLQNRGISEVEERLIESYGKVIDEKDIALGMPRQAVRESWGDPDLVEVAGRSQFGNERWHYNKDISSSDGFNRERRIIYFESGLVAGWETLNEGK